MSAPITPLAVRSGRHASKLVSTVLTGLRLLHSVPPWG
jgi:hypothetical protein